MKAQHDDSYALANEMGFEAANDAAASLAMAAILSFLELFIVHPGVLVVKRMMDIAGALIGLLLGAPFLFIAVIVIKLESPGPVLFQQERVGKNNVKFTVYKLRTMRKNAEEETGPVWANKNDSRVTRTGRFIRKIRLDEIPQFVNVLFGQMSLIGPRPERECFIKEFCKVDPRFAWRVVVKPGITGLAQINGGYELTPGEKLAHDLEYIRRLSINNDIKILLWTVAVVAKGEGGW